ncbi:NAD-dependent epimerase/dehydratase family protein [Ramlibacter alkalitolerans]|uniref:SDR family NAD(P)-dependent oxidoreductase n=1 Tax=Ramlibacter alkalitolerans TaxID=2039631 RepID=A0ABS1JWB7_9BURK|nr:SDR family NAD(P)-dependent oxidoreductase [Ramlibacter alkalitolerans]MBL0428492.1 SDR family NAD(P)-dependent oxidoreductase [Ramlibacter alkalitolerans]
MHPPVPAPDDGGARAPLAAVTGASGFIGRHVVAALTSAGWRVRLLLRRAPEGSEWRQAHPEVVAGSLEDEAALARLVEGADAVVHLAGLIKAARRQHFFDVNCKAVARLAETVRQVAPGTHFVLVSSLAAREPALSDYAASKRAGESAAREVLGQRVTVLRPPAVYGPHDRETLRFFQIARWQRIPLPGRADARAALIHVQDAARLVASIAAASPRGEVLAMADAHPEGYSWEAVLAAAARAVANPAPRFFQAPQGLLKGVALIGDVARLAGSASMLNSQKLRELRHPDWGVADDELARPAGWAPEFDLDGGFADAVAWYRAAGWLRS